MSVPAGFMTGMMAGQEQQQSLALGAEKLELGKVEIEKANMQLQQLKRYNDAMAKLNLNHSSGGTPQDGSPATPQAQAREMSERFYQMADVALVGGMPEEAREHAKTAASLQENAALMEQHTAEAAKIKATAAGNIMDWALDAKTDQEFKQRWQHGLMSFQTTYGKSPYAQMPPSRELAQAISRDARNAITEADLKLKDAETDKARAGETAEYASARARDASAELARTRNKYLKQNGGLTPSQSKANAAQADARESALDVVGELRTLIQDNPQVVGFRGHVEDVLEFGRTATGLGSQDTPSTDFRHKLAALKTYMPQALGTKNTRLKIVQQHLEELSDLRAGATSAKQAQATLDDLEKVLSEGTERKPGGKPGERTKVWKSKDEVVKAYKEGELSREAAAEALHGLGVADD